MHEIKFGLQIGNIMIYLTFPTWGVTWGPHTPEIEIFNVALELASLYKQIHSLI